ncbi:hypothetical protein HCC61_16125 [Streptomyces sp. HNM0575]|uniref:hypothetical protein n=1 Tax=Streptomyces sp. HNM0575 TaxID=2716338 RepID=UPI00145EF437|nr:hypothetical protein [Streptomyces sp. HNM0575]NLU74189.1 hypothetical protein [Streptomyces sp. HNM0575]
MRRIATSLGTIAAAGMIALAAPCSAQAADGTLIINGIPYDEPSGCNDVSAYPGAFAVHNGTDETAFVYSGPACTGPLSRVVPAGSASGAYGRSVYIR